MICPHGDTDLQFRFFRPLQDTMTHLGDGAGGHRDSQGIGNGYSRDICFMLTRNQPDGP